MLLVASTIMTAEPASVSINLAPEHAAKLSSIAGRPGKDEGAVASELLARELERIDSDPDQIRALLGRIPGAWDRIETGIADARAGRTISLENL
jgi:predicted transcriptional regulator